MRIVAGLAKGRRLAVPKGRLIRPATEQVREALFNILAAQIDGSSFLDLFAGSGSVGLEALSRGAKQVVFVEKEPDVFKILRENVRGLSSDYPDFEKRVALFPLPVDRAILKLKKSEGGCFNFIFMGPPYRMESLYQETLAQLGTSRLLSQNGYVILEQSIRMKPVEDPFFQCEERRRYGETLLLFYREKRT